MSAQIEMTADEFFETLTGYEEIAIEKHFGADVYKMGDSHPVKALRAGVFVHLKREGSKDAEAKSRAMEMPLSEVTGFFAEAEDEAMPEEPDTESGKDDSQPDDGLTNSLPSAS